MISVCMATYNGEKYIRPQIDSILYQLSLNDELIISDDGSTDRTMNILKEYNDPRIKIYTHHRERQKFKYGYTTKNIENALIQANGDIIFLSDQDDVWIDGKVKFFLKKLEKSDFVLSDCSIVDSCLNILALSKFQFENVKMGFWRNIYKNGYMGSSMAFKRFILNYALPFPKNVPHDMWIGLISTVICKQSLLYESTLLYRRHDLNVSFTNNRLLDKLKKTNAIGLKKNSNNFIFQIHYRLIVLKNFFVFLLKLAFINKEFIKVLQE